MVMTKAPTQHVGVQLLQNRVALQVTAVFQVHSVGWAGRHE